MTDLDPEATLPEREPAAEARVQTHWAAQVPSAASALMPAKDDFSHTTLAWDDALEALVGLPVDAAGGVRVGLRIKDLAVVIVEGDAVVQEQGLGGFSMREALGWLSAELKKRGAKEDVRPPDHDLPFHGLSQGLLFDVNQKEQEALAALQARAWKRLAKVAADEERAQPLRCWPHHLDTATLIVVQEGEDAESTKTIGVGWSPGDDNYAEAYWYVSPWPYPGNDVTLPILAGRGKWHLTDFVAAILVVSDEGDAPDTAVTDFLDTAIGASHTLIQLG